MKSINILAMLLILAAGMLTESDMAMGQGPPFQQGWGVATCFSGVDGTGQNVLNAPVVGTINLNPQYPNFGDNWNAPMYHGPANDPANSWTSANLGQVFGIAIDNKRNIYVAATTAYSYYKNYGDLNGKPNAWGPGGPGAIYRLSADDGSISNFIVSQSFNSSNANQIPNGNGFNRGVGLGDLCFSPYYNRLYATNMEDGRIYTIDPSGATGVIVNVYDPGELSVIAANPGGTANPAMTKDAGVDGFAPLGDRLWAVGYNPVDKRLYYGVWLEDEGASNPNTYNIIRSVALDVSGNPVPSTDKFEIRLQNYVSTAYSMPPSDIAFSSSGKMAIAERGKSGNLTAYPHQSRVVQYTGVSGSWSIPQEMYVGAKPPYQVGGTNSAGGVDYGYRRFDIPSGQNVDCDSMLWMSGDYLRFLIPGIYIYGLQGTPAETVGQTLANYWMNSYFIDLNGVYAGYDDKTQIGDVEIFRDSCGVRIPPSIPCDSLRVSFQYIDNGFCCFSLFIYNGYMGNYFSGIKAEVITPGVSFASSNVAAPSGWSIGTLNFSTIVWNAPNTGIPTGSGGGLQFCLNVGATATQKVVISWISPAGDVCKDTLTFNCARSTSKCFSTDAAKVTCTSSGNNGEYTFTYSFSLKNLSTYGFDGAGLYYLTSGVTISPASLDFTPPIAPGESRPITFTITGPGALPKSGLCFGLTVCDYTAISQFQPSKKTGCCTDTVCLVLPECLDCCRGFKFGAVQKKPTYDRFGGVALTTSFSPGPSAIVSASATIVSASLHQQCPTNQPEGRIFGDILGGSSFGGLTGPSFSTPPIESGYSRDITWGNNPAGVALSGASMTLNMIFPPPPEGFPVKGHSYCRDTLRFCVRYRFTDVTCRTCDTLICYKIIRSPFPTRYIDVFPYSTHGEDLGVLAGAEKSEESNALQGADQETTFASIAMSSASDGILTLNIPPNHPDAGPEGAISIVGLEFESAFGVRVVSLKDNASGTQASVVEYVAHLQRSLALDTRHTFTVKFNNYANLLSFSNRLGLRYVIASALTDTVTADFPVTARTPAGKGGDTLVRDVTPGEQRKDVRTYALRFTSGNAAGDSIAKVVIRAKGGPRILAIGPGTDSASVTLRAYASDSTGARWLLTAPTAAQSESAVATGHSLGPIYITVEGAGLPEAMFEYATVTADGDTVSKGEIIVREFTTGIRSVDDGRDAVTTVSLADCHPNPLTGTTTISFRLAAAEPAVWLVVSDVQGGEVAQLVSGTSLEAGEHRLEFNAIGLPSGVYYYTLRTRGATQTRTMHVVR